MFKRINLKTIFLTCALMMFFIVILFAFTACGAQDKVNKFVGNWGLDTSSDNVIQSMNFVEVENLMKKGIDGSKYDVITINDDGTYEHSSYGKYTTGIYKETSDGLEIQQTSKNSDQSSATLKIIGTKMLFQGKKSLAYKKIDYSAKATSREIRKALNLPIIDLSYYFAELKDANANKTAEILTNLHKAGSTLTHEEKGSLIKDIEDNYRQDLSVAFKKLSKEQKEELEFMFDAFEVSSIE